MGNFARLCYDQGYAAGQLLGRVALVSRQLTMRFGPLSDADRSKLDHISIEELDRVGELLLSAESPTDALGFL